MIYRFRLFFLALPAFYVLVLAGIALARSSARQSIMQTGVSREPSGIDETPESDTAGSNVHLQHFERVEFKNGIPVWAVHAGDARYFPSQQLTIVNQPILKIYRNKESDVIISGDVARLEMSGAGMSSARMDGNVRGDLGNGLQFATTLGTFDVENQLFSTREKMLVKGTGIELSGVGFAFHFDSGLMEFLSNVSSAFRAGASPPTGLPTLESKLSGSESAAKRGSK